MMRAVFAFLLAAFCVTSAAYADYGPEKLSDPKLEARAVALQRSFRCLVCQGESLDESNASWRATATGRSPTSWSPATATSS